MEKVVQKIIELGREGVQFASPDNTIRAAHSYLQRVLTTNVH
jgi:hypothetical protein